jgi:hypothetical protein
MQRAAGNHATATLVQRKVETPGGFFGEKNILGDWRNKMLLDMAAGAIDNPVHRKCVYHYGRMKGAPLKLDRDDLRAMNLQLDVFIWPATKAAITEAQKELRDRHRDPEREQAGFPPVIPAGEEVSRPVIAQGTAIANGSLGGCTAHIDGKVIVTGSTIRFEGMVHFTDRWDFDPAWLSGSHPHRTVMGELETIVGWGLLPGEPFLVDTETVPFKQEPGTGRSELQL